MKPASIRWTYSNLLKRLTRGAARALLLLALLFAAASPALAETDPEESRAYYDKAAKYVEAGKLQAAVIELKNALQRNPANADARLLLGTVYVSLGDGASAEKELRAAERHGIDPGQTVVPLGRALLLQGRFTEVMSGFDPGGREPDMALELRLLRAEAQAGLGQLAEARAAYETLEQVNAEDGRIPLPPAPNFTL